MGTLTRKEAREVVRLLRVLQVHLKSAIESAVAPGETEAFSAIDAPHIVRDLRNIESARMLVKKLSEVR